MPVGTMKELLTNGRRRRELARRFFSYVLIIALVWPSLTVGAAPTAGLPMAARLLAEPSWSNFQPAGAVGSTSPACSVTVSDPDGLNAATAQYRYSTNGGGSWTEWGNAGLSAYGSISTTLTITVNGIVFAPSLSANRIQYRIVDYASNTHDSPAYTVIVDQVAPGPPLGLVAQPTGWSSSPAFGLTWTNPADEAGIAAAYYKVGSPPTFNSDGTRVAGAGINSLSGVTVVGEGEHAVYVWLEDGLGNVDFTQWAVATLRHETTPPTPPSVFTSTTHLVGVWSGQNQVTVVWSGATDDRSGISGYALLWDQSPTTLPAPVTTTLETTATSPPLADGASHYAHVRARDGAGNWSAGAAHLGPFYIDTQAPPPPLNLQADPDGWTRQNQFALFWGNPGDPSGIAGAYYKVGAAPVANEDGTWVAGDERIWIPNISVAGDGAHVAYVWLRDKLGHVDYRRHATATLRYDGTPPEAPLNLTPVPDSWTNLNLFTLNWTNPVEPSGIAGAYYRRYTAPTHPTDGTFVAGQNLQTIANLSVASDGAHPVYVWLRNGVGDADHTRAATATLRYDSIAPTLPAVFTSTTHLTGTWTMNNVVTVTWSAATDALSGVAGYALTWDQSPATIPPAITTTVSLTGTSPALADGSNYAHLRVRDVAGNWSAGARHLGPFLVDRQAPAAPIGLTPNPATWTNQNQFALSWTNPSDPSGIAGAYYKLNAPPADNTDGAWIAGAGLTQLTNITVSGDGSHTVYVWLKDQAGNVDFTRHATATLRYNGTAPAAPLGLTPMPAVWTNVNSFGVSWTNPVGLTSIAGAYYKLGTPPTGPTDGVFVAGANIQALSNISVGGDGEHPLFVWLRDEAGNASEANRAQTSLRYDSMPPTLPNVFTSTTHVVGVWSTLDVVSVRWAGALDLRSGVYGYALLWDQSPTTLPPAITTTLGLTATSPALPDGSHYAHLRTRDNAGNWTAGALHLGPFSIDRQPPAAPISMTVTPITWTNTNAFTITWSNPADLAGIGGAYYKFNSAPASPADGTLVSGESLTSLNGISAPGNGIHTVYVWLRDRAGNVDHTRYATVTVYYNGTGAGVPIGLTALPSTWTPTNAFTLTWANPTSLAGIAGAYYKVGSAPAGPTDGTFVAGQNLQTIAGLSVSGPGAFPAYVWLRDNAGNVDHQNRAETTLRYDALPPTLAAVFTSTTHITNTWAPTRTIEVRWGAATEAHSGLAGYALVWDQITNTVPAAITTTLGLTGTFTIPADADNYYAHLRAGDLAGNWSPTLHLGPFKVDGQAPGAPIALTPDPPDWTNQNQFLLFWINPDDLSGIAGVYYKLDAPPASNFDGTWVAGDNHTMITNLTVNGDGAHVAYVWLRDKAGNVDYTRHATATLLYDGTAPAAPISLTVTPAAWTNVNAFNLSWVNPASAASIVGAYYKLGAVPTSPTDGTYVASPNIQNIFNLRVAGDGSHVVYVWLRDAAGNADHTRRASAPLRYDSTPPALPAAFSSPSHFTGVWSNDPTVDVRWTEASDVGSGVAGYALLWDQSPTTLPAAITTTLGLTGTSPVLSEGGGHYVHLRARDNAGNWTATALHLGPFYIDLQAPAAPLSMTVSPAGWTNVNQFTVSWVNPPDLAGMAGAYYKLNAPPTSNFDGTWVSGDNLTSIANLAVSGDGAHTVYVWLRDKAGNLDYTRHTTATLLYNGTAPAAPSNFFVTPAVWTNVNAFNLSWVNPASAAGIVGAYYKLGAVPTSPTDGTYVASPNIQSILNLTVVGDGNHIVHVWLRDAAGNADHTRRASATLRYDSTPPALPAAFSSPSHFTGVWSNDPTVDVRWIEASDAGSGVAGYALLWDQSPTTLPAAITTTLGLTDTSPLLSEGGGHYVHLRARDNAGNWTATALHLGPFYIDLQAPAAPLSMTVSPAGWTNVNQFTVSWVNPPDLAGMAGAYYKLNAPPTSNFDGTWVSGENLTSIANLSVSGDGAHTVYVWLRDKAGNLDYTRHATATLLYSGAGPAAPQGMTATPTGWTNVNSFRLSWTNPSTPAGIAGAYYKLNAVPTSPTDGTYVASPNIQNIFNLRVTGDGSHVVYVWLRDAAGNADHTQRASATLRYDSTPPALPAAFSSPSHFTGVWSNDPTVDVRWIEASDAGSGVAGYALLWDQSPTTLPAAITTTLGLTDTSPLLSEGSGHYVHLRARDAVGNWTATALHLGPFYIDLQAPAAPLSMTVSPAGWTNVNQFTVSWVNPPDLAGMAGAYYKLNAPPTSNFDGTWVSGNNLTSIANIAVFGNGTHIVYVWLRDKAGNVDYTQYATATLFYNGTGPAAPQGLTASPAGWSGSNSFNLSWTNPPNTATIAGAYYKLDVAPAAPTDGSYVASANIQNIFNIRVVGDGIHPVYVWLRDAAGNVDHTQRAQTFLRYDSTPPELPTVFTSTTHFTATWSNVTTVSARWMGASDAASGVAGYALLWDQSPTTLPPAITTTLGLTGTSPVLGEGTNHYAHLRARDAVGNWTTTALHLGPFYIDLQPPAAPISLTVWPATWTNRNLFTVAWSNPADPAGIGGAYYKLNQPPTSNFDGTLVSGDHLTALNNVAVTGDGEHTIYVWLRDRAGNVDYTRRATATLRLDTTPPGAPTFLLPVPSGWSKENRFRISWTNPPEPAGIAGAYYKLNSPPAANGDGVWVSTDNTINDITLPGEGAHRIYIWLQDRAGNVDHRTRNSEVFYYDATPPTTTLQLTGTLGLSGWYTSSVAGGLSAQDNLSGVEETRYRINAGVWQTSPAFSLSANGVYTVEYRSQDRAGNQEPTRSALVKIDNQPPSTTLAKQGTLGQAGWYTSPVSITLTPTDAVAGPALTRYRVNGGAWQQGTSFTLSADGIHQIEYYTQDAAGNQEAIKTDSVRIDLQAPTTARQLAGLLGQNNWYLSPVTVTLMPTDTTSGPAATFYRLNAGAWTVGTRLTVAGEAAHEVRFYSVDQAGNVEATQLVPVNIDMTAPLPPFNLEASPYRRWTNTNAFTITWTSLPDLSGIGGAYYKLNSDPNNASDGTFVAGANERITNLTVPADGKHTVYLWLRDQAGNADHRTRNVLNEALWLDRTPPTTTHTISGTLGLNGWYTSAVRVTLQGQDALSGIAASYYQLNSQGWNVGASLQITTSDRHVLQYYSTDQAGNAEATKSTFVRVDVDAPAAPLSLRVSPEGWQRVNNFTATWTDPIDAAGIGAAYYKVGAPPTSARDGTLVNGPLGRITGIQATREGKQTLYVWLVDNAGNLDYRRYASAPDALWYDAQPPTTTVTLNGTPGIGGWYRSAVNVTLSATDAGSGPAATYYRVNGGAWQTGAAVNLNQDGTHTIEYYSMDQAGNRETTLSTVVKIDTQPPTSYVQAPSGYQESDVVTVVWGGSDAGSGVLYYDVEYKDGAGGAWTAWRTATDETTGLFVGQRGHVYYLRSRARDRAGNVEQLPPDVGRVKFYIEPLANGRFETRSLLHWTAGGVLGKRVEQADTRDGGVSYMAVLGNPELGPCYDTLPPVLLEGAAVISQTVEVPAAPDTVAPKLYFWYHIVTYDVVWSARYNRFYDSFDVELTVAGVPTRTLLLRDGNFDPNNVGAGKPPTDLGWKRGAIDLSSWAGRTVTLYFSVNNRVDRFFNTWAYLDDVSIVGSGLSQKLFLPSVVKRREGRLLGAEAPFDAGPARREEGSPPPR